MKRDERLQFAKIILVSHKKEDYFVLCNLGFEQILWFEDIEKAAFYFNKHPENLGNYDVFFNRHVRGQYNSKFQDLLWENKEYILRVELYQYRYDRPKETIELKRKREYKVNIYSDKKPRELQYDCIIGEKKYTNVTTSFVFASMMKHLERKGLHANCTIDSFGNSKQRKRALNKTKT